MTKETKKALAKQLDKLIPFDKVIPGVAGKFAELWDHIGFEWMLTGFEKFVYTKLSTETQELTDDLLVAVAQKDLQAFEAAAANFVNSQIDIPKVSEAAEAKFFAGCFALLVDLIKENTGPVFETKDGGETPPEEPPKPGDK